MVMVAGGEVDEAVGQSVVGGRHTKRALLVIYKNSLPI